MSNDVKFVNAYIETLNAKIVEHVKRESISETQMRLAGEQVTELTNDVLNLTEQNDALVETAQTQESSLEAERAAYNALEKKYYDFEELSKSNLNTLGSELASARTRESHMAQDYQRLSAELEQLKNQYNGLDALYVASCADIISLQNEIVRLKILRKLRDKVADMEKPAKSSKKAKEKVATHDGDTFE